MVLKAFLPIIKGTLVQVIKDNTTAMWYCNKQGEVGIWTLCVEALRLLTWLIHLGTSLIIHHLVGSLNARAGKQQQHPEVVQDVFHQ